MDVAVVDCTSLFKQFMEVVTILQEDPTLQILNIEIANSSNSTMKLGR